jgi:hypothetical protein
MCSCDSGESAVFQTTTQPRARKVYSCEECDAPIAVGERYERLSGKWEGSLSVFHFCLDCALWTDAFMAEQRRVCECSGWQIGALWEEIREHELEHGFGGPSFEEQRVEAYAKRSQFRTMAVDGGAP